MAFLLLIRLIELPKTFSSFFQWFKARIVRNENFYQ